MSWNIRLVKNTVKIDSAVALELYNSNAEPSSAWQDECTFPMLEGIINNGKLVFNPDHMEHMDYVADDQVQKILLAHRVKGDVCFTSNEGDNAGESWGYRFDGEGGMTHIQLTKREWVESGLSYDPPAKVKKHASAGKKAIKRLAKFGTKMSYVRAKIDVEGFDYVITHFTSDVKDKKFRALVKEYQKAQKKLASYIART